MGISDLNLVTVGMLGANVLALLNKSCQTLGKLIVTLHASSFLAISNWITFPSGFGCMAKILLCELSDFKAEITICNLGTYLRAVVFNKFSEKWMLNKAESQITLEFVAGRGS